MDYIKQFWKYKKLFKTKKALELFLENDDISVWYDILKYYWPKTWKSIGKINWVDLADRVFSEYVRLYYADEYGICTCVTSGVKLPWYEMQAGHYRSRGHYPTRFDIRNVHPQTYKDNCILNWNYRNYHIYMVETYWPEVEDFLWCDNSVADYNQSWYEEHILERHKFNVTKKSLIKPVGC
jgi:hypothetical protein